MMRMMLVMMMMMVMAMAGMPSRRLRFGLRAVNLSRTKPVPIFQSCAIITIWFCPR